MIKTYYATAEFTFSGNAPPILILGVTVVSEYFPPPPLTVFVGTGEIAGDPDRPRRYWIPTPPITRRRQRDIREAHDHAARRAESRPWIRPAETTAEDVRGCRRGVRTPPQMIAP